MKQRLSIMAAFVTLLTAGLMTLAMFTPAVADEYKYTIRVFPGNRGTLPEEPVVVKVSKGDDVNLNEIATAEITDPKYVQTGYRLSGQDKLYGNGKVNGVSEDMDFVVAYGVEADLVKYTLKFVEYETGKELAEPQEYYGKDGDKPVAAYEYIEGYRPRYLSITGTLHKGEDNIWTFEYIPLEEGETIVTRTTTNGSTYEIVPGPTQTVYDDVYTGGNDGGNVVVVERNDDGGTGTTTGGGTGGTTGGNEANATGGAGTQGEDAENAATQPGAGAAEEEANEPETEEILDLDTPLAGPQSNKGTSGPDASLLSQPAIIASGCLGAIAVAAVWFVVARRRKAKQNEEA
ncbi:MAG: hypothetical protein IKG21_11865 [Atopobiaceae bacterium]|nr:hypothetical protein [Atopobiaceae bacterium]